jgi:hypothetical protein
MDVQLILSKCLIVLPLPATSGFGESDPKQIGRVMLRYQVSTNLLEMAILTEF